MLKGIPGCISPELLDTLMRMGHGDEIVLADADFPADTYGKRVIRADGINMLTLLPAILTFYPLDSYVSEPAHMMAVVGDAPIPPAWDKFAEIIAAHEPRFSGFSYIERYAFYKRASSCYAVVITGEADGNIILRKGTVSA